MDFINYNRGSWNKEVDKGNMWTKVVSKEAVEKARNGEWSIVLTPTKAVPKSWFPKELRGKKILCLASGGGQQGPILAATGAKVTVFDNSPNQLNQDKFVAERDGLTINTVQGDMRDLSVFEDNYFDFIIHPVSNCFIDNILPLWREAYRVLKKGGTLIAGFDNPIQYIFDLKELEQGNLVVRHKVPYSDLKDLSEEEFKELVLDQNEPMCFGHTLEDQIHGQIEAGFVISGFYEDKAMNDLVDTYIPTWIATKADKL